MLVSDLDWKGRAEMAINMTVLISWLALVATLYQLYLQRIHNIKSLRPLGQIDLRDRENQIYIRVSNNGMGPMIIDRLLFVKEGKTYTTIEECLTLARQSYSAISVNESVRKVILPHAFLPVFEAHLAEHEEEAALDLVRDQLSPITLKVYFRDIYDNKMSVERDFRWFLRHGLSNSKII